MDTTQTYIKMCEKATEIQKLFPVIPVPRFKSTPEIQRFEGSWFALMSNEPPEIVLFHHDNDENKWCFGGYIETNEWLSGEKVVWLPRQDQLQELVWFLLQTETVWFPTWQAIKWASQQLNKFDSMEQLWLAFVMKEKYSKVWDGDAWTAR